MVFLASPITAKAGGCREAIPVENLQSLNAQVINFEDKKVDPASGYWDSYGVKFTSDNGKGIYVNSSMRGGAATISGEYSLANDANTGESSANQPLKITFKEPINNFGFYFGNVSSDVKNIIITYFDKDGVEICSDSLANTFGNDVTSFTGYESDREIYSVSLDYGPVRNSEEIDDFMFVPVVQNPRYCEETDDGFDIYTKGYMTFYDNDGSYFNGPIEENCMGDGSLYEHICVDGYYTSQQVTCDNGYSCNDGACVADYPAIINFQMIKSDSAQVFGSNINSYLKANNYLEPAEIFVPNTMSEFKLNITPNPGNKNLQYSFVMTHPIESGNFNETSTQSFLSNASFGENSDYTQKIHESYRARNDVFVYMFGFVKNNDGVASVPNMFYEADDVSVLLLHLEKKPDIIPPTLSLTGDGTVSLYVNDTYTDAGATAEDNIDGDLTPNIVVKNNVNVNNAGNYTVTYSVADLAGNNAIEVIRNVNIVSRPSSGGGGGGGYIGALTVPAPVIIPLVTTTTPIPVVTTTEIINQPVTTTVSTSGETTPKSGNGAQVLGVKTTLIDELIASTKFGDRNDDVKLLQSELQKLGFYPKLWLVTGYYGPMTKTSVGKYLESKKMDVGQVLGVKINIIDELIAKTKFGERSENVSTLQGELKKAGFYPRLWRVTGYYGPVTKTSVEKYLTSQVQK